MVRSRCWVDDAVRAGGSAALERLRQLCEQELAQTLVPEAVVDANEAAELGASQLLRYLQVMNNGFADLYASGESGTTACAAARTALDALQDALEHGRADVADHLLDMAADTAAAAAAAAAAAGVEEEVPAAAVLARRCWRRRWW